MKVTSLMIALIASLLLYVSAFAQTNMTGTVLRDANLRTGPGTTYPVDGGIKAGQTVTITGQNSDKTWYHLTDGHWIFAALVKAKTAASTPAPASPARAPSSTETDPYTNKLLASASALKLATDQLNANIAQVKNDNALFVSPTWRSELSVSLGLIDAAALGFIALPSPPARYTQSDKEIRAYAQQLRAGITMVRNGFAQEDVNLISQGATQGFNAIRALTTTIQAATTQ
ncbi:MAG: SH3 domain-containing protein [Chloroflexi bacterium]|nr:SH3 domain-containing protein [Chloroflexota bacterium]